MKLANVIFIYLPTTYPRYAASLLGANSKWHHTRPPVQRISS